MWETKASALLALKGIQGTKNQADGNEEYKHIIFTDTKAREIFDVFHKQSQTLNWKISSQTNETATAYCLL